MSVQDWDPDRYARFAAERSAPFFVLRSMCVAVPGGRVVDLGCGDGILTAQLHQWSGAAHTLGIDTSAAMLARAAQLDTLGLEFRSGDLADFDGEGRVDLVFSNAALQWVDDHPSVLARLVAGLAPRGQLAIQVPANHDHPSHVLAAEVAASSDFAALLQGPVPEALHAVLSPEEYATHLDRLGLEELEVRLQVFCHHLARTEDLVAWTQATALRRYLALLAEGHHADYLEAYRERLVTVLGDQQPYFYPFKRLLFRGRLPR